MSILRAIQGNMAPGKRSIWQNLPLAPPDKIIGRICWSLFIAPVCLVNIYLVLLLGLNDMFKADTSPNKVNLGVGAYRDDFGQPFLLNSIKEAEISITGMDKEWVLQS